MSLIQVDRYQIQGQLGQGTMGTVYRAYDPGLDREVVLKLINLPDSVSSERWQQRFQREVRAAGGLNHPHIVTVHDVNLDHDPPYVVMELLRGGTLEDRLKQPMAWPEALRITRLLTQALAYAHKAGVVHRDVKPANIMFGGTEIDTLKLADFGLAYREGGESLTQVGELLGSPAYMAPEQARGELIDGRVDIFALGLILFEMISGHNPIAKETVFSTLTEVISETHIDTSPLVGQAPPEIIQLIQRAIAKDRDERYPTSKALLADVEHCLNKMGESASPRFSPARSVVESAAGPIIRTASKIELTVEVETVLRTMFSTFGQVAVEAEFGGGFSGSRVFRVRLIKPDGRAQLPAVVKIAPIGLIQQEWEAYQSLVEHTLPYIARLDLNPVLPSNSLWGGLRYTQVGGGTFSVQSLRDYYHRADLEDFVWILEKRLFEIMSSNWWLDSRANRAFQMQTDYDSLLPVNLLIRPVAASTAAKPHVIEAGSQPSLPHLSTGKRVQLKGFVVTKVDPQKQEVTLNLPAASLGPARVSCRMRLAEVAELSHYQVGQVIDVMQGDVIATRHELLTDYVRQAFGDTIDPTAERLTLPSVANETASLSLPNPLMIYQRLLQDFITVNISTVHGDLNMGNILIDPATREVSLIDFATVRQGHALHDLLRLETEVVIMLIPPELKEVNLPPETMQAFYEQLHQVTVYAGSATSLKLPWPELEKPFEILRVIRRMARKCLFNSDDWREYYQGLTLYLLGTFKFAGVRSSSLAPWPQQTAFWAAATALHLLEQPPSSRVQRSGQRAGPLPAPDPEPVADIESPYGTMRPDSKLYIERAVDEHCRERMSASHAVTLFIQAPRQMGKSSLMRRVLEQTGQAHGIPFIFIDFQKFPEQYFEDEENFLIELCLMMSEALGLPEAIDKYWQGRRTSIMKCSRYVSEHLISQLNQPFILAMDEVERMLTSPFQTNFFGMLRTWHNDRVYDENFARLSLFLSSSTEPYLFIDNPNQSPFNVAEVYSLQDFTQAEVERLNQRHHSPLSQAQVGQLMTLINGHPFLTRLSLYLLVTGKISDFETVLAQATEDTGPFGDHLRYYLLRVLQKPELKQALVRICRDHTHEENQTFYRLKGAGLIKKQAKEVVLRNQLYDRYFKEHLNV